MLNYINAKKGQIKYNGISVREVSPIMKINLRGNKREFFTTIGKNLNIILPTEPNTSSSNDKLTIIWLSPDEWMIVSNEIITKELNKYKLEEMLFNSISRTNLGSVTDVSDQFVLLELEGENIYELFASGSPFNFNHFKLKIGSSTKTLLNHTDVIVHNSNTNLVNLFVRRSFSQHLWSWINDSASRL